ncbi:uncharacterized protein LOC134664506 isoform X1 [Cydia fagiglandana]|uniref:uncharacterized protein LOC134664506 isoform X1 n=2 Tax=Cydia fagiglandana TaxID=1458189 RepID=UPI002FEE5916
MVLPCSIQVSDFNMAGTKINTKARKDDRSKGNKTLNTNTEDTEDHDFSLLRKPVLTSITGFAQAKKIFDFATEELKSLLANECDLLYECKVCRNIFRSLANFISHKRVYCKEKFNSSVHSHFAKNYSAANEMLKIKQMEEAYQDSLKVTDLVSNENEDRIPLTKDLTGIMEKLTKIKGKYNFDEQQVTLQKIPNSSVAVFQSHCEENKYDNMLAQVQEINNMISRDNAVLQRDGSFNVQSSQNADKTEDSDNVIQISDDEDSDEDGVPKCKICDMQFSTQKTLKFHMKYKHLESRLVFPCPDCLEIFSTSWSVYRHLFKVHRKSAAQIRRLRDAIQGKAFRMNNPPAFYEKKKNSKPITPQKISEEERLDQENQAWMDNMEGDGELPRCGGCGRTFERRAALAAHTHTCQPRCRALARRPDAKRIEIQIRKDYHKGPTGNPLKDTENKQTDEEVQNLAKAPEKDAEPTEKTPLPDEKNVETEEKATDPMPNPIVKNSQPEIIPTQKKPEVRGNVLEEATMDIIDDRSSDSIDSPEKIVKPQTEKKTKLRLPFAHQAEKSNLAAFKQRLRADVDMEKLLCKKCDTKNTRVQELHEHMAGHYKWMRYACKLCNFKNYDFEKLPEHVKVVHKLKGDSDFYFSTVKALDGPEATELAEPVEESDVNEESSESRRPSRCSSDSSRLSDDSSSSSAREVGARKRKMYHNRSGGKKRKENGEPDNIKEDATDSTNNIEGRESPSNVKPFEENSSDIDDLEEKLAKQANKGQSSSYVSRRPVRKKTKPKNEDFEYDLSNLLKMEAQGYRESQIVTPVKPIQTKKKLLQELQSSYDNINKEHVGALALLSKKAVDRAAAELKTTNFGPPTFNVQKELRLPNIFARPMVPKGTRGDKISPRKDITEDTVKDGPCLNKMPKIQDTFSVKDLKSNKIVEELTNNSKADPKSSTSIPNDKANIDNEQPVNSEQNESVKAVNIPSVNIPIKFRRQSLEVMKNPIINKNISDFSKAGMKTKILLIKPINRNKDGVSVNTPLKFQTIKLKEPNKGTTSNEENSNDQIVVVKVPKVERSVSRNVSDNNVNNNKIVVQAVRPESVSDAEAKIVTDAASCPAGSSENTTKKPEISCAETNPSCNSNRVDQINSNHNIDIVSSNTHIAKSLSDGADILETTKNIEKDSCVNQVSNNMHEPMDIQEINNTTPNAVVISDNVKEINSNSTCSVEESPIIQKPDTDLVGLSHGSCTSSNNAISLQESVSTDSTMSNDTPS